MNSDIMLFVWQLLPLVFVNIAMFFTARYDALRVKHSKSPTPIPADEQRRRKEYGAITIVSWILCLISIIYVFDMQFIQGIS